MIEHLNPHVAVSLCALAGIALTIAAIIYGAWSDARAWRRALEQSGYGARGERREIRDGGR